MPADSHVVRALAGALRLFGVNKVACHDEEQDGAAFRVVSYRHDFDYLWGVGGHRRDGLPPFVRHDADVTVVVVWDGFPPRKQSSMVPLELYLTPVDWAVGLSLELEQAFRKDQQPLPGLRLVILELNPEVNRGCSARAFFDQLPGRSHLAMPWLRLATLVGGTDQGWNTTRLLWEAAALAAPANSQGARGELKTIREALA